ncbi:MAG: glycosyltransferase family 39 protein [Zoogloea sp.]|nr:glycosyltransferase family 39 protein [Zoogloea sp.]
MSSNLFRNPAQSSAFWWLLAASLGFRLWLAGFLPMTGDEAYFVVWGNHPGLGHYGHPPMLGWWLAGLLGVSDAALWLRLPAVLMLPVMALVMRAWLRHRGPEVANAAALVLMWAPVSLANVLISTDAPLALFGFMSLAALQRALEGERPGWFCMSGLMLGLALLSGDFAVLLGLAYLGYFIARVRSRRAWTGFALLAAFALPAVALSLWWNWQNCWDNLPFDLLKRWREDVPAHSPLVYLAMMVYMLLPPALWMVWRRNHGIIDRRAGLLGWAFWLPAVVFGLLSFRQVIALHWLLAFFTFWFAWLGYRLDGTAWRKLSRFTLVFGGLHMAALIAFAATPLSAWHATKFNDALVFTFKAGQVWEKVRPSAQDHVVMVDDYAQAAMLSYHARRDIPVFGTGSHLAREDDRISDFRGLDGRNILILTARPVDMKAYAQYFRSVRVEDSSMDGVVFHQVLGDGFNYAAYRDGVLAKIRDDYYRMPAWLPKGKCGFCEKYFGDTCPAL